MISRCVAGHRRQGELARLLKGRPLHQIGAPLAAQRRAGILRLLEAQEEVQQALI